MSKLLEIKGVHFLGLYQTWHKFSIKAAVQIGLENDTLVVWIRDYRLRSSCRHDADDGREEDREDSLAALLNDHDDHRSMEQTRKPGFQILNFKLGICDADFLCCGFQPSQFRGSFSLDESCPRATHFNSSLNLLFMVRNEESKSEIETKTKHHRRLNLG